MNHFKILERIRKALQTAIQPPQTESASYKPDPMSTARRQFVRILLVDDYEPFRSHICSMLRERPPWRVVGEASSGVEAVRKAKELLPDLVLLDFNMPEMNGLEAARIIRDVAPGCKILFVSQEDSPDLVRAALNIGAHGYISKMDAGAELVPAMTAVISNQRFVGRRWTALDLADPGTNPQASCQRVPQ